ncbi:hypothetical protein O181_127714, partial [Austropuccinia psidii MF-1]|nr:hypothetical protein [Austropuccinia psidii MF-1]
RPPLSFCLTGAFHSSVAAFAETQLQFCPHALKLSLLRVLQLLRSSQLHHGIKDHLHTTRPSLSFSPAPLRSTLPAFVLLNLTSIHLVRYLFFKLLSTLHTDINTYFSSRLSSRLLKPSECRALYAPSGVSPAFVPQRRTTLVMLADKHTRNVCSLSAPSDHEARGVPAQDALARTPLWSTMMKPFPSVNGRRAPKQANGNDSGRLALSPPVLICPLPLLGHHPMVTSLLDRSEVIIRPMKDGDGERTFELGLIVTNGIQTPNLPREQTPRQPTPGPSGTRWSEELFR